MKTNWTYILGALIIGTLSLSACGKKGGSAAAPTAGADSNTPPGQPTNLGRGSWQGYLNFENNEGKKLMKQLLKKSGLCYSNNSCKFTGAWMSLRLIDPTLPGRGALRIQTFGYNQWLHNLQKTTQALPENNGFQLTYNVNGGQWYGGHSWNWNHGGQHCYWKQTQQNNGSQFYVGLGLNLGNSQINAQYQQGYGLNQAQYVCEEIYQTMDIQSQQQQQQMGPQVIDPNNNQMQMQSPQNFWIGYQVQAIAEFKDASKTCIVVRLYYMGQLIGSGELNGVVY